MEKAINNLDLGAKGIWFPITVSILLFLIILFIPKRHTRWSEIYMTFGVVGFATWISDAIITRVFDLIDLGNPEKPGLGEILCYTFVPTSLASLYINYLNKDNKIKLTILFSILSTLIEYGMSYFGYMKTEKWFIYLSFPFYLLIYGFILPIHLKIIRKSKRGKM